MISETLLSFIAQVDLLLKDVNFTHRERLLSRTVKLNEEVGELCEAILADTEQQPRKNKDFDLESEIADVIITTLLIAKEKNIDVTTALEKKMKKIKGRFNI